MKFKGGGVSSAFLGAMSDFPCHSCSVDGWLIMFRFGPGGQVVYVD